MGEQRADSKGQPEVLLRYIRRNTTVFTFNVCFLYIQSEWISDARILLLRFSIEIAMRLQYQSTLEGGEHSDPISKSQLWHSEPPEPSIVVNKQLSMLLLRRRSRARTHWCVERVGVIQAHRLVQYQPAEPSETYRSPDTGRFQG